MPNGRSIILERQQGADAGGHSGLEDEVDNHWVELFKAALLSTILGVGAELGSGADSGSNTDIIQALRLSAANSLNQTGQQVVRRNLNIQPTLTIRPGFPVRVIVNRDLWGMAFNIPGERIDGMNIEAVCDAGARARARAAAGEGPTILEMATYRYRGHSMSDPAKYRTREEVDNVRATRDPIEHLRGLIEREDLADEAELKAIDAEAKQIANDRIAGRLPRWSSVPAVAEIACAHAFFDFNPDPIVFTDAGDQCSDNGFPVLTLADSAVLIRSPIGKRDK